MSNQEWGEPCLLSLDEERLIYLCNYYSRCYMTLEQCRVFVDSMMEDFAKRVEREREL